MNETIEAERPLEAEAEAEAERPLETAPVIIFVDEMLEGLNI